MSNIETPSSSAIKMDIDTPGFLKRSNSAPMIHNINSNGLNGNLNSPTQFTSNNRSNQPCNNFFSIEPRARRFSASFTPRVSYLNSSKLLGRVDQIRQEECTDILDREVAHENKLLLNMRMSQSWEDLRIMLETEKTDENERSKSRCGGGTYDSFHNLPSFSYSSPSPTRCHSAGYPRQCYSPSILKANLSPSPTRSYTTRSGSSPITVRPSSFGSVKRKFDLVDNEPSTKRGVTGNPLYPSARSESSTSPLPSSSSVGTPESFSSADSPNGFLFSAPDSPLDHPMRDISKVDSSVV